MEATGVCWTRRNIMEPVSVRVSPCAQRVPGPIQAVTLSEEDSTSSDLLARPSKSLSSLISITFRVKCPRPTLLIRMMMGKMTVVWQVRILRRKKKPLTQRKRTL